MCSSLIQNLSVCVHWNFPILSADLLTGSLQANLHLSGRSSLKATLTSSMQVAMEPAAAQLAKEE